MTYQKNSGLDPKKLIQDVATRWKWTYLMLVRFCELKENVKATQTLLDSPGFHVLSRDNWKVAKELTIVLNPFFEATKSVNQEKYSTAKCLFVS